MTKPDPCEKVVACELGSPKYAKIVTTPGERSWKIGSGSKVLPGRGATFELASARSGAGVVAVFAVTTTVRLFWSNQAAPLPMPNAAPPPRTAATRIRAASGPARTKSLYRRVLVGNVFPWKVSFGRVCREDKGESRSAASGLEHNRTA